MALKEVTAYVSHPIRGRHDVLVIRGILDEGRKALRRSRTNDKGFLVRPIAPYLLHATVLPTSERVVAHRIERLTWVGEIPYTELHLHGDELCDAMRAEILHARKNGIEVVVDDGNKKMAILLHEFDQDSTRVAA